MELVNASLDTFYQTKMGIVIGLKIAPIDAKSVLMMEHVRHVIYLCREPYRIVIVFALRVILMMDLTLSVEVFKFRKNSLLIFMSYLRVKK